MNDCVYNLMAANGCFTKKNIKLYQRLKSQVFQKQVSLKVKEVCHLELSDIYLEVMKSICRILTDY